MAKKILCVVLSVVMLMGVLVVGSFAAVDYKKETEKFIIGGLTYLGQHDFEEMPDEVYASMIAADPDIVANNLQFWADEIVDEYYAAETNADWQALYEKVAETWLDDEWEYYIPLYRDESKAIVDVKYETDVAYAKPGDTITVTVSAKTNFDACSIEIPIIFDKNVVTYTESSISTDETPVPFTKFIPNENYGWRSGRDDRVNQWPAELRENQNGAYDKYAIIKGCFLVDAVAIAQAVNRGEDVDYGFCFDDYTPLYKAQFTVNSGVADGEVANFFSVPTANIYDVDEYLFHEDIGSFTATAAALRVASKKIPGYDSPDEISSWGQTFNYTPASVTIGEEVAPVEYADYTELDAAIEAYDETVAADYTPASWAAYEDAVDAGRTLARDILLEDQAIVDAATAAITGAELVKNSVVSAEVVGTPTIGADAEVKVVATGSPELIRLTGDSTMTFDRESATIVDNGDGTETWTIAVFADTDTAEYSVYAKYVNYTESGAPLVINAFEGVDLSIHSIIIPDMYPNAENGGAILKGKHEIIIRTSKDVTWIQFVADEKRIDEGATYTYPQNEYTRIEDGDEYVWTLYHNFGPLGTWSMPIRTRSATTLLAKTGQTLDATVLY